MKKMTPFFKILSPAGYSSIPDYSLNVSNNQTFTTVTYKNLPKLLCEYTGVGEYEALPTQPKRAYKFQVDASLNSLPALGSGDIMVFSAAYDTSLFGIAVVVSYVDELGDLYLFVTDNVGAIVGAFNTTLNFSPGMRITLSAAINCDSPLDGTNHILASVNGSPMTVGVASLTPWTPVNADGMALGTFNIFFPILDLDGKVYSVQYGRL